MWRSSICAGEPTTYYMHLSLKIPYYCQIDRGWMYRLVVQAKDFNSYLSVPRIIDLMQAPTLSPSLFSINPLEPDLSTFDFSVIFFNIEVWERLSRLTLTAFRFWFDFVFFYYFFSNDLFSNIDVSVIATISFSLTDRRFWFEFRKCFFFKICFDLILFFCSFFYYLDVSLGATISLIVYCFSILIWVSKIRFFVIFLSWS